MSLDGIKAKMQALRVQQEEAQANAEELHSKVKVLEQDSLAKEQEITSLSHRNQLLEAEVEKLETGIKELKIAADQRGDHGERNEALQRRLQLLEDEAEESDKKIRETSDKLRQTDVKAGSYERRVQALEHDRDQWEAKCEEMAQKYKAVKTELEQFQEEIGNM